MFPLRSGPGSVTTLSSEEILYQSLTASAMHEIANQAIVDCGVIMFHQQAADVYYREEQGQMIPENPDGTYDLYPKEELDELRKDAINTVMKYHILHPTGAVAKLTPLIQSLQTSVPLAPEIANDPFIQKIMQGQEKYSNDVFHQNIQQILEKITDFSNLDNLGEEVSTQIIMNSYDSDSHVNVAIFEDDSVQCACNFCNKFFEIHDIYVDRDNLNPVQRIMLEQYNF